MLFIGGGDMVVGGIDVEAGATGALSGMYCKLGFELPKFGLGGIPHQEGSADRQHAPVFQHPALGGQEQL